MIALGLNGKAAFHSRLTGTPNLLQHMVEKRVSFSISYDPGLDITKPSPKLLLMA